MTSVTVNGDELARTMSTSAVPTNFGGELCGREEGVQNVLSGKEFEYTQKDSTVRRSARKWKTRVVTRALCMAMGEKGSAGRRSHVAPRSPNGNRQSWVGFMASEMEPTENESIANGALDIDSVETKAPASDPADMDSTDLKAAAVLPVIPDTVILLNVGGVGFATITRMLSQAGAAALPVQDMSVRFQVPAMRVSLPRITISASRSAPQETRTLFVIF